MIEKFHKILENLEIDYLLVNSTNEYLVEYSSLQENARAKISGFLGSTGDVLLTKEKQYLFVDGRYHEQADLETYDYFSIVKLQLGQNQDDEIRKIIDKTKTLGIVAKKVSQTRLESFTGYKIKLLDFDPINDFTESHNENLSQAFSEHCFTPENPIFISNLEEVSYLTGLRDFSKDFSSKIYAKLFVHKDKRLLFRNNNECANFLKNFDDKLLVDKSSINAFDYSLIKYPVSQVSPIKFLKSIKTKEEIEAYKKAFAQTDKAVKAIREFIENNKNLSEYDISTRLREEFIKYGAKSLSFRSIVAIDKNSALAHYSKNSKDVVLKDGSLVLIDCGAYYDEGYATDITRVFVKGSPDDLQKKVYTTVLKAFLNAYNSNFITGFEYDKLAHKILDNKIDGFQFNHGLGHGIGINVHEAPPALNQSQIAQTELKENMTFTIEPGLYNPEYFGVRLENSCYKTFNKVCSFTQMGYEGKLIDFSLLTENEQNWLKEFEILWK